MDIDMSAITGKFVISFVLLSGKRPVLDCVRETESNRPYLYDSIEQAKKDQAYDSSWDEIIPAEEYYKRTA